MSATTTFIERRLQADAIEMEDDLDVAFWALMLDVSAQEIRRAAHLVGANFVAVSRYITSCCDCRTVRLQ